ncbi:MAG: DNA-3-methyladenine glycosylase family protein [Litorivicinus sp.]
MESAYHHLQSLGRKTLSDFVQRTGILTLERRYEPQAWPALVRVVVGQQVSTQSANAIWQKLLACGESDLESLFLDQPTRLEGCGLSRAKQRTLTELFQAKRAGELDLDALREQSFETRMEALTPYWGIGPWSVQMFSMFHCLDGDIWSPGDLALRKGVAGFAEGGDPDALIEAARPYRTYLALYCWEAANAKLF